MHAWVPATAGGQVDTARGEFARRNQTPRQDLHEQGSDTMKADDIFGNAAKERALKVILQGA